MKMQPVADQPFDELGARLGFVTWDRDDPTGGNVYNQAVSPSYGNAASRSRCTPSPGRGRVVTRLAMINWRERCAQHPCRWSMGSWPAAPRK